MKKFIFFIFIFVICIYLFPQEIYCPGNENKAEEILNDIIVFHFSYCDSSILKIVKYENYFGKEHIYFESPLIEINISGKSYLVYDNMFPEFEYNSVYSWFIEEYNNGNINRSNILYFKKVKRTNKLFSDFILEELKAILGDDDLYSELLKYNYTPSGNIYLNNMKISEEEFLDFIEKILNGEKKIKRVVIE